jgi:uncharacterized phage protein (TIGR02220 family)
MYSRIEDSFWRDEKLKKCSIDARHIFLYLLTSPHRNILGCYYLPKMYAMFDLGMVSGGVPEGFEKGSKTLSERFDEGFDELLSKGFIKYDESTSVVFIRNFLRHNKIENSNQVSSACKKIEELPSTELLIDLVDIIEELAIEKYKPMIDTLKTRVPQGFAKGSERVSKPVTVAVTVTEAVTVSETVAVTEPGKPDDACEVETVEKLSGDSEDTDETEIVETEVEIISEIVDYLNDTVGAKYKATSKKTKSLINARFNEGFVLEDFKAVIMKKSTEWIGTDFEKFLRPETLFGTKFESYLNQRSRNEGDCFKDALSEFMARGEDEPV